MEVEYSEVGGSGRRDGTGAWRFGALGLAATAAVLLGAVIGLGAELSDAQSRVDALAGHGAVWGAEVRSEGQGEVEVGGAGAGAGGRKTSKYAFIVVANAGGERNVQLSELEFLAPDGSALPFRASSSLRGCVASQNVSFINDARLDTKFCTEYPEMHINLDFEEPVAIGSYRFATADDNPGRDPATFYLVAYYPDEWRGGVVVSKAEALEAGDARMAWVDAVEVGAELLPARAASAEYALLVTRTGGDDTSELQLSDLYLYTESGGQAPFTATSPFGGCTFNQNADKLADNNPDTKFCSLSSMVWVKIKLAEPAVVTGFSFRAADDNAQRDPTDFSFNRVEGEHAQNLVLLASIRDYIYNTGHMLERQHTSRIFPVLYAS
mmetsp:Transcript_30510/g.99166  ORF Transcript_30510/g.99166 Transcript_30510/m.99166 type:complete len:381 (-) Transcript_30510:39-1181(-)